jgi:hypothetical protein
LSAGPLACSLSCCCQPVAFTSLVVRCCLQTMATRACVLMHEAERRVQQAPWLPKEKKTCGDLKIERVDVAPSSFVRPTGPYPYLVSLTLDVERAIACIFRIAKRGNVSLSPPPLPPQSMEGQRSFCARGWGGQRRYGTWEVIGCSRLQQVKRGMGGGHNVSGALGGRRPRPGLVWGSLGCERGEAR